MRGAPPAFRCVAHRLRFVARRTACVSFLRARPIKKKKRKNPPYFFFADSFALHDGLISGEFAPVILRFRVRPGRPPDVGATVPVRKTEVKSLMRFRILSIVSSLCNKPIASCCLGAAGRTFAGSRPARFRCRFKICRKGNGSLRWTLYTFS